MNILILIMIITIITTTTIASILAFRYRNCRKQQQEYKNSNSTAKTALDEVNHKKMVLYNDSLKLKQECKDYQKLIYTLTKGNKIYATTSLMLQKANDLGLKHLVKISEDELEKLSNFYNFDECTKEIVDCVWNNTYGDINKLADQLLRNKLGPVIQWNDIEDLDGMSIQRLLRDVDSKDLVVALYGTKRQQISDKIFQNMSQRMGETVKSDVEYLHNVRESDVELAQRNIINVLINLIIENEIYFK